MSPIADNPPQIPKATGALDRWLQDGQAHPYRLDLWQALRRIDAAHPRLPRLGEALRPADEPVRLHQPASLDFAPAAVSGLSRSAASGHLELGQRVFGLLGPNGPLPLHMTELVHERQLHHGDRTLQAFLDLLTQRFGMLFYRAWAQAQPVVGLDRPGVAPIHRWLGALAGIGIEGLLERDALGDAAKLHFSGRLLRQVRDADGLQSWCREQFDAPLQVLQWCGHWMTLERSERTRLGRNLGQQLGRGAVIGGSVWDVQHKFRIVIGPLDLDRYLDFLPGGRELARLQAMVRQWVGLEFAWDVQLILARRDVPRLRLGQHGVQATTGALGRSGWLGRLRRSGDADSLVIDVERTLHARRRRVGRPERDTAATAPAPARRPAADAAGATPPQPLEEFVHE